MGLLGEVERFSRQLQAAEAIASAGDLDAWMQRRADDQVPGARKGLDAAIYMALSDVSEPPAEDVAAAAGRTVEYVESVRARIGRKL